MTKQSIELRRWKMTKQSIELRRWKMIKQSIELRRIIKKKITRQN